MNEEKFHKLISWGQYVHWANIQYEQTRRISKENCHYSRTIGAGAHWLAAQYVVIEGWNALKEKDASINRLLSKYEDYVSILRRCRNAVYHYQDRILDNRIQKALGESEMTHWAAALQDEFERFLFMYPFKECGMCAESINLHNEYFGCIGWKPTDNVWVKWFDVYFICVNYVRNNDLNELEKSKENDEKIIQLYASLMDSKPNELMSKLSRLRKNT